MNHIELIRSRIQKIVEAREEINKPEQFLTLETQKYLILLFHESEWLTTFALEALEELEYYAAGKVMYVDGTINTESARSVIDRAAGKE